MTNTITILAIVALVGISVPSAFACSEGNVQHWNNVQITLENSLPHTTEPTLPPGTHILLPIPTMGPELLVNDFRDQIVAERLNELGYTQVDGDPVDVFDIENVDFNPDRVGYSTICKNGVQQMIGGMLLQPDTMTLALAYTITNSIWIAPLAIGAGAGIYLTKSKWKR